MKEIQLDQWRAMRADEQERFAKSLCRQLPTNSTFVGVRSDSTSDVGNSIAEFEIHGARFNLIPGTEVTVGFDADQWDPSEYELASWEGTAEEYDLDPSPNVHLQRITNGLRTIRFPTSLVEVTHQEYGWQHIDRFDSRVERILKEQQDACSDAPQVIQEILANRHETVRTQIHYQGDEVIRLQFDGQGGLRADEFVSKTHADLVAHLKNDGFRLPTSDEWEYLCGGGITTLFRWGDHAPCDRYPTDISREEIEWRTEWVRSSGKLERPVGGFTSDWDYHRIPNSLGLLIAQNPYQSELVNEPGVLRGGDGGCSICGGIGYFAGWLPLATAYFEKDFCQLPENESIDPQFMFVRRLLPLG